MPYYKIISAAVDTFKQNLTIFCQNNPECFDRLDEETFHTVTSAIMNACQSAGKAGLEMYLNQNDTRSPAIVKNGKTYRYKGVSRNDILTLMGNISVKRTMYYDEHNGGEYLFPLDNALGLCKDDFATLETREMILYASSCCIPKELEQLLKKFSMCKPSRTAIQNIINKDGRCMEDLREEIADTILSNHQIPAQTKAVVTSLDGVNVLLNEPGKKKGRKNLRPGTNATNESPTSYHNAMVGSVSFYGTDTDNDPLRYSSIYTARMPEEKSLTFKYDFERMLADMQHKIAAYDKPVSKILLTDGHLMIKGFARQSSILKEFEPLIDFFHTAEHLSKAAEAMYGQKTDKAQWWYWKWYKALKKKDTAAHSIVRLMKSYKLRHKLSAKRIKDLKTEITFFSKNKHLMKYAEFKQRGLPIGSGPIEAAAKSIVKQRMCRSGMRWSREKGQYVLTVRAMVKSDYWDQAWKVYKILKKAA